MARLHYHKVRRHGGCYEPIKKAHENAAQNGQTQSERSARTTLAREAPVCHGIQDNRCGNETDTGEEHQRIALRLCDEVYDYADNQGEADADRKRHGHSGERDGRHE